MQRLRMMICFLGAAGCALLPLAASSQSYPTKPIRVVVTFPPGPIDITIRTFQGRVLEDLGQPLVIENRAGANGFIGAEYVARAAPDGYTLLATSAGTLVHGPILAKTTPFDSIKDFTPITLLTRGVNVIVVKPSLPVSSVKELVDYAKRNPGKLFYASGGVGSLQQFDAEVFKLAAGVDIVHVPYKGFGAVIPAFLGGEVDVAFITLQIVQPHILSGKAKLLSTYDGKRHARLPRVPDVTETLPDFRKSPQWVGILAPAGLPRAIVTRLNSSIVKALNAPDVRPKLEETSVVIASTPEDFAATLKTDLEQVTRIQKRLQIQAE